MCSCDRLPIALNQAYYEAYWHECALRNYEKHQLRHIHTGPIASVFIIFMCTVRNKSQMAHSYGSFTHACLQIERNIYSYKVIWMLRKTKSDQIKWRRKKKTPTENSMPWKFWRKFLAMVRREISLGRRRRLRRAMMHKYLSTQLNE